MWERCLAWRRSIVGDMSMVQRGNLEALACQDCWVGGGGDSVVAKSRARRSLVCLGISNGVSFL